MCRTCARRGWFRRHGFDWPNFLDHGIAAERLMETGDATALRVVRIARQRESREAQEAGNGR